MVGHMATNNKCGTQGQTGPRRFKSQSIAWAASQPSVDLPLDFLKTALSLYGARGEIRDLQLRVAMNVDVAAAAREQVQPQIIDKVVLADEDGEIRTLSGAACRIVGFAEFGQGYDYPPDLAAGAGQAVVFFLNLFAELPSAEKPSDYRIKVAKLLGGSCAISFSPAIVGPAGNTMTVNSGAVELWAECIDARKDVNPSRLVMREWPITGPTQTFPVKGRLRSLFHYVGTVGENAVVSVVQPTQNLTIPALEMSKQRSDELNTTYVERVAPRLTAPGLAADENDPNVQGASLAIVTPRRNQATSEMAEIMAVDWESDVSPTLANKPLMIASWIADRPGECRADYEAMGTATKAADGRHIPTVLVAEDLAAKLPTVNPTDPTRR